MDVFHHPFLAFPQRWIGERKVLGRPVPFFLHLQDLVHVVGIFEDQTVDIGVQFLFRELLFDLLSFFVVVLLDVGQDDRNIVDMPVFRQDVGIEHRLA